MIIDRPRASHIPALTALWQEAFGDSETFIEGFFRTGFSPERSRCLWLGEQLAAALYWFDCRLEERPIAYVYAVATAKAFRGQGLCRKLMENTRLLLANLGYSGIILVPEAHLFPMYEGMGYRICSHIQELACRRGDVPVALQEIDCTQYAQLRRQYLPAGGVLQENENLQFLSALTKFYAGDDFVYAENAELLGNTEAAPGILAALGKTTGTFRCPGNGRPFAMYLPLDNQDAPAYFGLAFD